LRCLSPINAGRISGRVPLDLGRDARFDVHGDTVTMATCRRLEIDQDALREATDAELEQQLERLGLLWDIEHDRSGTVRVITPYGSLTVNQILGRQGEMLAADALATIRGEPLPERDPLRLLAKLRALRDSGAISTAEFEIRKSAIWREI
jgi:hypothetical protein